MARACAFFFYRVGVLIGLSMIGLVALYGCQSREELLVIPLEGGAPRWLAVEAEATQLAHDVEREAVWLVGQAAGRASCLAGAAQELDEAPPSHDTSSAGRRVSTSMPAGTTRRARRLIDPNTASLRQLESLPRVGPATARAIVEGRPYARIEDLTKVRGIGPASLESLRPLLLIPGVDGHSDRAVDP